MNQAYLLTGGNLGNRTENLARANELISTDAGKIIAASGLYETAAWGKTDQPDFLNQALQIETALDAKTLLERLLGVEKKLGRERQEKYGARTIDIDILFFGNDIIASPELTIPHSQLENRRFVLVPLAEIAGEFLHPVLHKNIRQLLQECPDPLNVKKIPGPNEGKPVHL